MEEKQTAELNIKIETLSKIKNPGDLSYLMLNPKKTLLLPNTKWIKLPPDFPDAGETISIKVEAGNNPQKIGVVIYYSQGSTLHQGNNNYQFEVSLDISTGEITAPVPGGGPWPDIDWSININKQEVIFKQEIKE